jgi:phosphate:Na+ symporter
MAELQQALNMTHTYLGKIRLDPGDAREFHKLRSLFHILDHLHRVHERFDEEDNRARVVASYPEFAKNRDKFMTIVTAFLTRDKSLDLTKLANDADQLRIQLQQEENDRRSEVIHRVAEGAMNVVDANDHLEGIRWLKRVSIHLARILYHLSTYEKKKTGDDDDEGQ